MAKSDGAKRTLEVKPGGVVVSDEGTAKIIHERLAGLVAGALRSGAPAEVQDHNNGCGNNVYKCGAEAETVVVDAGVTVRVI